MRGGFTEGDAALFGEAAAPDVADSDIRKHLSASAIRLFLALADKWRLTVDQRRTLLGGIARPTYHNWKGGKVGTLTRDQLERISLLLGIHKGMRLLFADDASADRWFRSANTDIPFGGRSPFQRARAPSTWAPIGTSSRTTPMRATWTASTVRARPACS